MKIPCCSVGIFFLKLRRSVVDLFYEYIGGPFLIGCLVIDLVPYVTKPYQGLPACVFTTACAASGESSPTEAALALRPKII